MENRFDILAKLLALGMSRRQALRQLGGTAAGTVLAALGLGCRDDVVGPQWPTGSTGVLFSQGQNRFAEFCRRVFPPGPERGRCNAAAAHGEGLAVACGGDVSKVCETATQGLICCDVDHPECCPLIDQCCEDHHSCCGTAGCCNPGDECCVTPAGVYTCCDSPRACDRVTGECVCPAAAVCDDLCCESFETCCSTPAGSTCCSPDTICGISTTGLPVCLPSPP